MRLNRLTLAPAVLLALILAACGGATTTTDGADAGGDAQATPTADAGDGGDGGDGAGAGDAGATVDVTVTGGEFEGNYEGSVAEGGCSRGATGENTFGLQYSTSEAVELSSLQLVVNDAEGAAGGGTDDFQTSLTFGDLLEGTTIDVQPPESQGSGTVEVDDRGDTATITIDAETSEGVGIDATVECHSVFDFGG
jgi:hypothetical protein